MIDSEQGLWAAIAGIFGTLLGISRHSISKIEKVRLELKEDGQRLEDRHDATLEKLFDKLEEINEKMNERRSNYEDRN